jgi:hypothetical protein
LQVEIDAGRRQWSASAANVAIAAAAAAYDASGVGFFIAATTPRR